MSGALRAHGQARTVLVRALVLFAAMASTAIASRRLEPTTLVAAEHQVDLARLVPERFGRWIMVDDGKRVIVDPGTQAAIEKTYSQLLNRSYVNEAGEGIMLAIAYGNDQRRSLVAHRPDVCYPAQGFAVGAAIPGDLATPLGNIPVERMFASKGARMEPVTFWFTMGNQQVRSSLERRLVSLRYSLTGEIPDGLLFRVSSIDGVPEHAYALQGRFVRDLEAALGPEGRGRLLGLH